MKWFFAPVLILEYKRNNLYLFNDFIEIALLN